MNEEDLKFKVDAELFDRHRYILNQDEKQLIDEYCAFSNYMQDIFIKEGDYIIDVGNFQNVNYRLVELLEHKRMEHPIKWRLLMWLARV